MDEYLKTYKRREEKNDNMKANKRKSKDIEDGEASIKSLTHKKAYKRRTLKPEFINEEPIVKDFFKTTRRNLKNMDSKRIQGTIGDLENDIRLLIPNNNLELITKSCKVLDANGKPLLYFLKGALKWPFKKWDPTNDAHAALKALVQKYPPPPPMKTDERHKGTIHDKECGVFHLGLWHAKGWKNAKSNEGKLTRGAVITSDTIATGYKFNCSMEFIHCFTKVSQAVGALFHMVDDEKFTIYRNRFNELAKNTAASILKTSSWNCFLGMGIIVGLSSKPHRDSEDVRDGWVADTCFGDFEGGFLEVPQVKLKFEMKPGDVVYMKSALLQHSVSKVTSGKRFGVVFFSHESVMR